MSGNLTIGVDINRDLYLDNTNNLAIVSGETALIQSCEARIEAQLREMIYAYNQGMPTMDTAFRQQRLAQFVAAGRARLLTVVGVLQVQSFQAAFQNGQLYYTASILTVYSESIVNLANQGV